jgi:hypothetical protein
LSIALNDTATLNNGLEIDIVIPSIKCAIEINGPAHHTDIFGVENLRKTQMRDIRKKQDLARLGYHFWAIDISPFNNLKQAKPHLTDQYLTLIKPKLLELH